MGDVVARLSGDLVGVGWASDAAYELKGCSSTRKVELGERPQPNIGMGNRQGIGPLL